MVGKELVWGLRSLLDMGIDPRLSSNEGFRLAEVFESEAGTGVLMVRRWPFPTLDAGVGLSGWVNLS
jgi:hypothetical protein